MSLLTSSQRLIGKYGKAAKVIVSGVLNVVAPGSGALLDMAAAALDAAGDVLEKPQQSCWEAELAARMGRSEAELKRLGQLLECLLGPLAILCDKAAAFADQAEDLPDIIARALAANPSLSQALHGIEGLKFQFESFQSDLRRVAQHQADALPVYERMNRVADYFDELWTAGIKPRDFAHYVHSQREVIARIEQGQTGEVDDLLLEMRTATPKAASVCVLEAAVATRDGDYPAAQRALNTAVRLRPQDTGLAELSRRVTVLATHATPKNRPPAPASAAPPTHRLQPGDALDGWGLEARLGAGGWGQVLKASRDGQSRALKVMHPEYAADRAFVERFKKEIEALMRLPRHANLVRVESFGYCTTQHTWYLVMEHLDGPTLEQYLASKGPFTEPQVRKVFPDLVEGLARAHASGIVHRDIKPSNLIFRRGDQRLVLVDFGLAVAVEKIGDTQIGGISIQFAAPEQHYGEPATQASDVFSLCAVIHYALTHDQPDLRKPHCFTPSLAPESLREVLTAGLRSNARERLQDGGELQAALASRSSSQAPSPQQQELTPNPSPTPPRSGERLLAPPPRFGEGVGGRGLRPAAQAKVGDTISNELGMKFAWVPPGKSWLGGGDGKPGTKEFTLAQGLWCGVYPVTQAEWQAVMGKNLSHFDGNPQYPVESVSWNDVQEFLKQLNARAPKSGLLYRLPTEEEWEYICRGGPVSQSQSAFHFYFARSKTDLTPAPTNDLSSTQANFDGNYPVGSAAKGPYLQRPSEVGLYLPNPLGICDLHGNVWEWTSSQEGSDRVFRGGSWVDHGAVCAAAYRGWNEPGYRIYYLGFRLLAVPSL